MVWTCYRYSPSHGRKCSECGEWGKSFYKTNRSSRTGICPRCFIKNHPRLYEEATDAIRPQWDLELNRFRNWRYFYELSCIADIPSNIDKEVEG